MSDEIDTGGLTRREALKKGAALGGALVWAVPVVQTIGMSPAMAQTVSEGNCCLRIQWSEPVYDPVGKMVEFQWTLENCGSTPISAATGYIDISSDDGMSWDNLVSDNKLNIPVGGSSGLTSETANPGAGTYLFRMHGEFRCFDSDPAIWHTIPGGGPGTYLESGPLVVP